MTGWMLAAKLARRELRGGLRGFRIFLGCLIVGVAAIAAVGSVSSSVMRAIETDAKTLLGGDATVRFIHRPAEPAQLAAMTEAATVAATMTMRAMARSSKAIDGAISLVELKAVDASYPLYGQMTLAGDGALFATALQDLLASRETVWGVVVEPALLDKLSVAVGALIRIGEADFEIRGVIAAEPDRVSSGGFTLGPRALVSRDAMAATGLVQPGSLITYDYKIRLPAGADANAWTHTLAAAFPDAGWRLRTAQDVAPGLALMVDRMTMFLTFVGLTALLVGGVGVANAVRAYLEGKVAVIATFKSLGADAHLVFRIYLLQIMAIAGLGIAGGLILGAAAPLGVAGLVDQLLPVEIEIGVSVQPLVIASLFGALTALVFTIWPVAQAGDIPAATLFRNLVAPAPRWPRPVYVAATAVSVAALIGLAVATADRPLFALWFVAGAGAALAIFRLCGSAIIRAARAAPRMRGATWRLAVANLHRPGAPTASIVLSLGLGLAVLVAIAQTQGNLERRLIEDLPEAAPSFFVIDIQKDQLGAFNETVLGHAGVSEVQQVPMLRGRIAAIDGVAAENRAISADVSWTLQGDRGITWSATPVANSEVVEGQWWAEDYRGPTLISFDQATARGYGVGIGDTLTVNILGRLITGEIANLRRINWGTLGINFFMVFSPGALDGAPQTYLATVYAEPEVELALQSKIVGQFANITAVRVRDAIETVAGLVRRIALAIEVSALVTLFAGILVLGGAVAAGQRRRIYDAVIMKVLGATRGQLMRAFALEFGLIGLATALTALAVGTAAAWAVVTQILGMSWVFLPGPAIVTAIAGIAATLALGFAGTYAALSQKAAPHLRNE